MILKDDAERMEEIMCKTADRCDIWQDRYVYWIAVAIWHIIQKLNRLERRNGESLDNNSDNTGDSGNNNGTGISDV